MILPCTNKPCINKQWSLCLPRALLLKAQKFAMLAGARLEYPAPVISQRNLVSMAVYPLLHHPLVFVSLFFLTISAQAASEVTETFEACIERLQQRGRQEGLPEQVVSEVLGAVNYSQRVIELDRSQPEFAETFSNYLNKRVTQGRIERGRELLAEHRQLLLQLQKTYGVQPQYLVSFWGLETNYGSYTGNMPVLDSLATLACDPRRSDYFSSELMAALQIVADGVAPETMLGSWAGALGQTQFMPSAYQRYARDGDGDGKVELWLSPPDALASAAAFLQDIGWQAGWRWGREVMLPANFPYIETGRANQQPLSAWRQRDVRTTQGERLPAIEISTAILVPAGHQGPAFAVYDNFDVILGWNRSEYYAIAVGHLADRISGAGALKRPPPASATRLSQQQVEAMQITLNAAGFDAGKPDGVMGPGTRAAIQRYQQAEGLVPDSFPDAKVLAGLGVALE
jgi:membrane-bound lytic murein transglycosylase B